jgi:hypothetical protein
MEDEAYDLVLEAGNKGLLQSDLWKKLGVNSREGSRISVKLEKKGLARRAKELYKGRWTYRLYASKNEEAPITWNTLNNCPCFMCVQVTRCGTAQPTSPIKCQKLTNWINKQVTEF